MAKKNVAKNKKNNKSSKSGTKKTLSKPKVKKSYNYNKTLVITIIIIAIIAVIALNYDKIPIPTSKNSESVAASVNGEVISIEQLDDIYNRLPEQTRMIVTKSDLLAQMINEKILTQEAEKEGLEVSEQEINEFMNNLILQSGLNDEEFNQRLITQNITRDMVIDEISKQLIITKLYQKEILDKIEVSDEQVNTYYNENKENFKGDEQVKASHILICHTESTMCESNLTKEEAYQKSQDVLSMIDETNFGDLAIEHSMGPSSTNGGDLGYFGRGVMVKQFEDAAFDTEVNGISDIIETSFGYHLIKVFDKKDAAYYAIEEVSDQIKQIILAQNQQDSFAQYLDNLKAESTIINFYDNNVEATTK